MPVVVVTGGCPFEDFLVVVPLPFELSLVFDDEFCEMLEELESDGVFGLTVETGVELLCEGTETLCDGIETLCDGTEGWL